MPYTEADFQPFAALDEMVYAPTLPSTSLARGLRIRPRRAIVRQWVLPPDTKRESGLHAPVHRYAHPRVWGWLLAATARDCSLFGLMPGSFYHWQRFADEWMGDDAKPDDTIFTFDELPVALIHIESLRMEMEPHPPLPVTALPPAAALVVS